MKRSGPFSEPPDSEKAKSCCPHPLPENQRKQQVMLEEGIRSKERRDRKVGSVCLQIAKYVLVLF